MSFQRYLHGGNFSAGGTSGATKQKSSTSLSCITCKPVHVNSANLHGITSKRVYLSSANLHGIASLAPRCISEAFFKMKLNVFLDTLIQKIWNLIIKINIFRGELSTISAKKASLPCITHKSVHVSSPNLLVTSRYQWFCFQNFIKRFLDTLIQKCFFR